MTLANRDINSWRVPEQLAPPERSGNLDFNLIMGGDRLVAAVDRMPERKSSIDRDRIFDKPDKADKTQDLFVGLLEKSPTLQELFKEIDKCPWGKNIKLRLVPGQDVAGYDPQTSQVVLGVMSKADMRAKLGKDASDEDVTAALKAHHERVVEQCGHCLYSGMHQSLNDLYNRDKPMEMKDYVSLQLANKARAYLVELKINRELKHENPIKFHDKDMTKLLATKRDGTIDEEQSTAAIQKFLEPILSRVYEANYKSYIKFFDTNKKLLTERKLLQPGW